MRLAALEEETATIAVAVFICRPGTNTILWPLLLMPYPVLTND